MPEVIFIVLYFFSLPAWAIIIIIKLPTVAHAHFFSYLCALLVLYLGEGLLFNGGRVGITCAGVYLDTPLYCLS